jgi:hypothetical protein
LCPGSTRLSAYGISRVGRSADPHRIKTFQMRRPIRHLPIAAVSPLPKIHAPKRQRSSSHLSSRWSSKP